MTTTNNVVLLIVAVVYSAAILFIFDARVFGPSLIHQFESRNYPSVTGQVMRSKINEIILHNSGPTRVKDYVDIGYQYEVNQQSFETNRFRYSEFTLSGHSPQSSSADFIRVQNIVSAHPVGSEIKVYFNPGNPADAVLATGIDANDEPVLLLLTLLNSVILFLAWHLLKKFRTNCRRNFRN